MGTVKAVAKKEVKYVVTLELTEHEAICVAGLPPNMPTTNQFMSVTGGSESWANSILSTILALGVAINDIS